MNHIKERKVPGSWDRSGDNVLKMDTIRAYPGTHRRPQTRPEKIKIINDLEQGGVCWTLLLDQDGVLDLDSHSITHCGPRAAKTLLSFGHKFPPFIG